MKIETYLIVLLSGLTLVIAYPMEPDTYYCGGKPADVYFLVDTSTSIWGIDFLKQLDFIANVIEIFDVNPDRTRIGMGLFANDFYPQFSFKDYTNKSEIIQVVKKTEHRLGGTYTAKAIRRMREEAFAPNVARQDVAHIAIILTDGKSMYPEKTAAEAKLTKDKGIYIFAIGIGMKISMSEINNIASESEDPKAKFAFHLADFDALASIQNILAIKTCLIVPKDQPRCPTTKDSDIIFAVDPLVMGDVRTNIIKEFIANTADQLDVGNNKPIRIGVFINNCPSSKDIHLNAYQDKYALMQQLRSNDHVIENHILRKVRRRAFKRSNGGRADARRLVVTFLDGPLENPKDVFVEAQKIRKFGADIFVIAIGNEVQEDELKVLASGKPKEHIFRVTNYETLKTAFNDFVDIICEFL